MTVPIGGLRDRLIYASFIDMIEASLRSLGWFSSSNMLITAPVDILAEAAPPNIEVLPNKISVVAEETFSTGAELGSDLEFVRWDYFVEIFAENEGVGKHLSGDIRDILKGKIPSIGRNEPELVVLDIELATPVELFVCSIEDVESQRTRSWDSTIRQNWWTVACTIEDTYGNENDS